MRRLVVSADSVHTRLMDIDQPPSPEEEKNITSSEVSQLLKEQGLSPEGCELLGTWLDSEHARVEAGETSDLKVNLVLAEVYRDAGLKAEAIEAYEDVRDQAYGEGNDLLREISEAELKRLRG